MKPVEFISRSQAGQDMFAHALLGDADTFLDVGANAPVVRSNSYALEQIGWRGLCVDNSAESMLACEKERTAHFYFTDASQPQNWAAALMQAELSVMRVGYLSLDVDQASLECLKNLPMDKVRFAVVTCEHDEYARPGTRDQMVTILRGHGYDVLCADVMDQGLSFEIWAVDPKLVNMQVAAKFRRDQPTEWREFFK